MTRTELKESNIQSKQTQISYKSLVLKTDRTVSPKLLREIHTAEPTKILVFSPDGKHMIQISFEGAIQLRTSDRQTVGSFMAMPDVHFKRREVVCCCT